MRRFLMICVLLLALTLETFGADRGKMESLSGLNKDSYQQHGLKYLLKNNIAKRVGEMGLMNGAASQSSSRQDKANQLMDEFMLFLAIKETGLLDLCLGLTP